MSNNLVLGKLMIFVSKFALNKFKVEKNYFFLLMFGALTYLETRSRILKNNF
jgi:hypothetical protein